MPVENRSAAPGVQHWQVRDLVVAVLGGAIFAVATLMARGEPSGTEIRLFRLVNQLPGTIAAPLTGVMQLGALVSVGGAALVAAAWRRRFLARTLLVSGVMAWMAAKLVVMLVARRQPDDVIGGVVVRGHVLAAASYPSTHTAVAAAMAMSAAPFLGRFGRRLGFVGVVGVALSRVYVGAQFPLDALGGLALGALVAGLVRYVVGTPLPVLGVTDVEVVLQQHRVTVGSLRSLRSPKSSPFVGTDDSGGQILVHVASRHEFDEGWLARVWRFLAFRDLRGVGPLRSPRERSEHVALMTVLAERSGASVPRLLFCTNVGAEYSVGAYAFASGGALGSLPSHELNASLVHAVLGQLQLIHEAGVVLGGPAAAGALVVDRDRRPWFTDFSRSSLSSTESARAHDLAAVLAVLVSHVDASVVIDAANGIFGATMLDVAAAALHPLEYSRSLDSGQPVDTDLLARTRSEIARVTGTADGPVVPVARVAARNLAVAVAAAVAVALVLGQVGQAKRTVALLRAPQWQWVGALLVASTATYLGAAIAARGSIAIALPLTRTCAVQIAAAFTNRIAPAGLGGMATNVRFLERSGSDRSRAVGAVTLNSAAGFVVHLVTFLVVAPFFGQLQAVDVDPPKHWPLVAVIVVFAAMVGVLGWIRFLPKRFVHEAIGVLRSLGTVVRSPKQALQLFGGSLLVTCSYACALFAALNAVGVSASLARVVVVYLSASAVAALSPTPGGLGALEAGLVVGLSRAGVPASASVAGVLLYRFSTYWLPVLPGSWPSEYCAAMAGSEVIELRSWLGVAE